MESAEGSGESGDGDLVFDRLETPSQLAAQLINKLEKHKKILEKETPEQLGSRGSP